jgi:hypothetical protein
MKNKIEILIVLICITLLTVTLFTYSIAIEDTDKPYIEIIEDMSNYEEDRTIELTINLKNMTEKISYLDAYIEYDQTKIEQIKKANFTNEFDEDELLNFNYSTKANKIVVEFENDVQIENVCKIKIKVLDTVESLDGLSFKVYDASGYSYESDKTIEFNDVTKTFYQDEQQPGTTPLKELYLSSEEYKIGDNDINNYEDSDEYISRIQKETSKEVFISNLETNGTIRILKADGTELLDDELVGTGMTLEVTKDEEKIELKIAVMGDLTGDGKTTATDLSTLNQSILQLITLENEYKLAADLDENNSITATDLSTLNKMLLNIL